MNINLHNTTTLHHTHTLKHSHSESALQSALTHFEKWRNCSHPALTATTVKLVVEARGAVDDMLLISLGKWGGVRIEMILPSDGWHEERREVRVTVRVNGGNDVVYWR